MTQPAPIATVIVDEIDLTNSAPAAITFSGPIGAVIPAVALLKGARQELGAVVSVDDGRWSVTIPLEVARWGGAVLPAPSGDYLLSFATDAGDIVHVPGDLFQSGEVLVPGAMRIGCSRSGVVLSAPLTDDERGTANQARLEAAYRSRVAEPENAVMFESFYGQNASCNPRALDAAIAQSHPATARYWSVSDLSVAVPPGAIAIVNGSDEWWRVRADARLIIVNDWLRKRYRKRPHQTVLQTWHGTMLKKIAINRPHHGIRATIASILEGRRWDVLLSQNPHSTAVLRSAYKFTGPIWEDGYPRDDALAAGNGESVRARLGIPASATVVLYAPTWRDDRLEHIDHLDVAAFTDALGEGYITLIRGHSRTLRPGRDVRASNVIDVTGYPDVADLFLVADALITDYSSVMFDFSVTGKPIFFYTPDLDHYGERLRGFYFDLIEVAPGPVVQDPAQLVSLVTTRDAVTADYKSRYAAWRARFNPRDDGHAAERVVARLESLGALR